MRFPDWNKPMLTTKCVHTGTALILDQWVSKPRSAVVLGWSLSVSDVTRGDWCVMSAANTAYQNRKKQRGGCSGSWQPRLHMWAILRHCPPPLCHMVIINELVGRPPHRNAHRNCNYNQIHLHLFTLRAVGAHLWLSEPFQFFFPSCLFKPSESDHLELMQRYHIIII